MNTRTKRRGKKVLGCVAALALAGTMGASGFSSVLSLASTQGNYAKAGWTTDFETYEEEQEYAARFNQEIVEEGAVLLKNKNNALPLAPKERDITLFGTYSYKPLYGGTGSAGMTGDVKTVDLVSSLEKYGFNLNQKVANIYGNVADSYVAQLHSSGNIRVEIPVDLFNGSVSSYSRYGDAAIITISRLGGEGYDVPYQMRDQNWGNTVAYKDPGAHILMLTDNEKALIKHMGENFEKVIVLINSGNVLELGDLEDDPNVDAILYVGQPGASGFGAVPRILAGEVNPSGKTVDIYPAKMKSDPTWNNFGSNVQHDEEYDKHNPEANQTTEYNNYVYDKNGKPVVDSVTTTGYANVVEYEEGIYVGYRWYETAAAEKVLTKLDTYNEAEAGDYADEYYNRSNGVVYPFGHGLSYTTFKQELVTSDKDLEKAINEASGLDAKVQVKVKVTNTGDVAGKEVVQLYVHAPYTKGGIEKSEVVLVGYAKTSLLQPDKSETVTVDVRLGDIASFDYNDANKNDYKGYEIEAGNYEFRLQSDSHNMLAKLTCALEAKTTELDNDGNAENNTPFSNGDDYDSLMINKDEDSASMTVMSRADFKTTYPTVPTKEDRTFSDKVVAFLASGTKNAGTATDGSRYTSYWNSLNDKDTDPWAWYADAVGENWTQAADTSARQNGLTDIQLGDMIGIDYWDDETVVTNAEGHVFSGKTGAEAWEIFMNQLTWDEVKDIIRDGHYQQTPGNDSIGLEVGEDADGPAQLQDGTWWACAVLVGCTWNVDIAYEYGELVGNESLFLDVPGWYGPSMNIHRSQFGGRTFEYFSSDGLHSGLIAAAMVKGAQSKGVNCYIKHVGINEQETSRYKLTTYADEQTIREVYFKSYEYAIKEGEATGVMTAMSRIGSIPAQSNYMLMNTVVRGEWGFKGAANSDGSGAANGAANYSQRGGCDFPLGSYGKTGANSIYGEWDATARDNKGALRDSTLPDKPIDNIQWYAVRTSAMRVLWVAANTNYTMTTINLSLFTDCELTLNVGSSLNSANIGVGLDEKYTAGQTVTYKIVDGNIPTGAGFNELTGNLTDIAMENGTFKFKVTMYVNGVGLKTINVTLESKPMIAFTEGYTVKAGEEFTATLTADNYMALGQFRDDNVKYPVVSMILDVKGGVPCKDDKYELTYNTYTFNKETAAEKYGWDSSKTLEAVEFLEGETLNESATLKFTPTTPGTYLLNVKYTYGYAYKGELGTNKNRTAQIPITVLPADNADDGKTIVSIAKTKTEGLVDTYTITFNDSTTYNFTITNGAIGETGERGPQGLTGVRGPQGEQGIQGADGVNGTNGTNGTDGANGTNGTDGKGVASAAINDDGELVLTYTDGTEVNLGVVKGADGADGKDGTNGTDGKDGADGKDATLPVDEGCGSAIDVAVPLAAAAGIILAGAVVFTVIRRRKNN